MLAVRAFLETIEDVAKCAVDDLKPIVEQMEQSRCMMTIACPPAWGLATDDVAWAAVVDQIRQFQLRNPTIAEESRIVIERS